MDSVKPCWSLKHMSKWSSGENLEKWPKMASITLRMAIFFNFWWYLGNKTFIVFSIVWNKRIRLTISTLRKRPKASSYKNAQKVPNMAILVHIMANFLVFQDIRPWNMNISECKAAKWIPQSPVGHWNTYLNDHQVKTLGKWSKMPNITLRMGVFQLLLIFRQ